MVALAVVAATSRTVVLDICGQTAVLDRNTNQWTQYSDFTFGENPLTTPLVSNGVFSFNAGTLFFAPR